MCAAAGTSASSRLSVNSSNHSGRSRKRSSEARVLSFLSFFGESRQFPGAGSAVRSDAGLEDALDESCDGDVQGQTIGTKFSVARKKILPLTAAPTRRYIRVLRRVFHVMEPQACHHRCGVPGFPQSRHFG